MNKEGAALVTGAGSGIGRAVAEALAKQGHAVGLVARTSIQLSEVAARCNDLGAHTCIATADIRSETSVVEAIQKIEQELGPVDILVNSAGVSQTDKAYLENIDNQAWSLNLETNLRGTYLTCHYLVGAMKARRRGVILNIGSTGAHRCLPGNTAYSASKFAVRALTEGLAEECDGTGVSVYLISPGPVDTGIWDKKKNPPELEEREHMLRPEDIADIALWLISRPAHVRIDEIVVRPTAREATTLT